VKAEIGDGLVLTIFRDGKVFGLQSGHGTAFVIGGHHVQDHKPRGRSQDLQTLLARRRLGAALAI